MWKQLTIVYSLSVVRLAVAARKWHDSGTGTIIFEEAWTIPELLNSSSVTKMAGALCIEDDVYRLLTFYWYHLEGAGAQLADNLLDIHNQRFGLMKENNIDFVRANSKLLLPY